LIATIKKTYFRAIFVYMMIKNTFLTLLLIGSFSLVSQAQKNLWVAFYNQENLFDTIDDPHKNDNEFLPDGKNTWNTERYTNKINHMAKVIASMNDGKGPDIMGMCEVENDIVLTDLTNDQQLKKMRYAFVHFEGPDDRSIDNALIYQSKKFNLVSAKPYPVFIAGNPRFKTRDILMVSLREKKTKTNIILLVNHFPSRLGGEAESQPKRIAAAKILNSIYDSIHRASPEIPVIMMGDFNDEPMDASMTEALGAKGQINETDSGALFNAMFSLQERGIGSHYYKGEWHALDQMIMSQNLIYCSGKICYQPSSVGIYKQNWMVESDGKYSGAPLRTLIGQKYLNGYSDHLPVFIILNVTK
jgi:predicted extracellular nuclease